MSDLQVWADANRNGFLEPNQIDRLTIATIELLMGPHPGRTPLDGMFDLNSDGRIDEREVRTEPRTQPRGETVVETPSRPP